MEYVSVFKIKMPYMERMFKTVIVKDVLVITYLL